MPYINNAEHQSRKWQVYILISHWFHLTIVRTCGLKFPRSPKTGDGRTLNSFGHPRLVPSRLEVGDVCFCYLAAPVTRMQNCVHFVCPAPCLPFFPPSLSRRFGALFFLSFFLFSFSLKWPCMRSVIKGGRAKWSVSHTEFAQ